MSEAVIVDVVRTPIGRAGKGSLVDIRADDLAVLPFRALADRNPAVDLRQTDDVLMGCAVGAGEQGYNVARTVSLLAGLGNEVPATTIQRFCASSLQAVRSAFHAIRAGEGQQYIAAGVESVSRYSKSPWYSRHPRFAEEDSGLPDVYIPMGLTAENVARKEGVSREAQDEWAFTSQSRAAEAQARGHFDAEIISVDLPEGRLLADESPRPGTTLEGLAALKPAFAEDGTVTAGNSCPLNDGAAAALIVSSERAAELRLKPRARIIASSVAGVSPEEMGLGPIPAVQRVLAQAGMTMADIDIVELNEAFASQVVACRRRLDIDPEKLNPSGGAIALGHPYGMTGVRILATLLNGLEREDKQIGLETMCVAGGMGQALIIERL